MPPIPPHQKDGIKLPRELEPLAKPISPGLAPMKKKKSFEILFMSLVIATAISVVLAVVMVYFRISVNVILPVLAPIWVGLTTLIFLAWKES